jgi:hypothetical protein
VTIALLWCWLGVGMMVFADARRASRVTKMLAGHGVAMRFGAPGVFALAGFWVARDLGVALGIVVLLLEITAAMSAAVLLFALRPRAYAATLPAAAISALLLCLG